MADPRKLSLRCFLGLHPHVITGRGIFGAAATCLSCGADAYGLYGRSRTNLGFATAEQRRRIERLDAWRQQHG